MSSTDVVSMGLDEDLLEDFAETGTCETVSAEYLDYMRRKVEKARESMRAGRGRPHAEVEAEFAAWRRQVDAAYA